MPMIPSLSSHIPLFHTVAYPGWNINSSRTSSSLTPAPPPKEVRCLSQSWPLSHCIITDYRFVRRPHHTMNCCRARIVSWYFRIPCPWHGAWHSTDPPKVLIKWINAILKVFEHFIFSWKQTYPFVPAIVNIYWIMNKWKKVLLAQCFHPRIDQRAIILCWAFHWPP